MIGFHQLRRPSGVFWGLWNVRALIVMTAQTTEHRKYGECTEALMGRDTLYMCVTPRTSAAEINGFMTLVRASRFAVVERFLYPLSSTRSRE